MTQEMIAQNEICHRLDDRNRPRQNAGIMTAATFQFGVYLLLRNRRLRGHNGRSRLKGDPEENWLPIGNPALYPPRAVRLGANSILIHIKMIIVFRSREHRPRESGSDLKSLQSGHPSLKNIFQENECTDYSIAENYIN